MLVRSRAVVVAVGNTYNERRAKVNQVVQSSAQGEYSVCLRPGGVQTFHKPKAPGGCCVFKL